MCADQFPHVTRSALFGLVAPSLGWAPPLRYLLRRARILRLMARIAADDTVEVGCGAGALLDDMSCLGFRAVGLEMSPRALAIAQALAKHGGGSQTIVDRADPAWAESKGLVCSFDVLEHIENDRQAVAEWVSWLRPGGWLMLSVPAHRRRWDAGDEWAGHWRRYDREDLVNLLRTSGLSIAHLECYGFPLANLTEWVGARTYRKRLAERAITITRGEASAHSGIERAEVMRLFRYLDTVFGRAALRFCIWLQAVTARTDWGSGYLVLARRP